MKDRRPSKIARAAERQKVNIAKVSFTDTDLHMLYQVVNLRDMHYNLFCS